MPTDPTALVLVDLQVGTLRNFPEEVTESVLSNARLLIAAARAADVPLVFATYDGATVVRAGERPAAWPVELVALHPTVDVRRHDLSLTRHGWSAFAGTDLDERLTALGITHIVVAGVATSFGVESTARDAYDRGYRVVVATDAVADFRAESHEGSIQRVFPVLGAAKSTADIIDALATPRISSDD